LFSRGCLWFIGLHMINLKVFERYLHITNFGTETA
jgi:hypothetical protein